MPKRSAIPSPWPALCRFLEDGRIDLDTNTVERVIRPVTLGRKNHLFTGSDRGAERWRTIARLVTTAKLNDVEPQAWFTDLLPWNWRPGAN